MWVYGLLCLLAFAAAAPAPKILESEAGPYTNVPAPESKPAKASSDEDKGEVEVFTIPAPPELKPLVEHIIVEYKDPEHEKKEPKSDENIDKEEEKEKDSAEANKEEEKEEKPFEANKEEEKPEKPVEVILTVEKPSFWSSVLSHFPLSWSHNLPLPLPSWNLPFSWPSIFGGRSGIYPSYPDYRYIVVE